MFQVFHLNHIWTYLDYLGDNDVWALMFLEIFHGEFMMTPVMREGDPKELP